MESLVQGPSTQAPPTSHNPAPRLGSPKWLPVMGHPRQRAAGHHLSQVMRPAEHQQPELIIRQGTRRNETAAHWRRCTIDEAICCEVCRPADAEVRRRGQRRGGAGSRLERGGYSFVHRDNQISPEGLDLRVTLLKLQPTQALWSREGRPSRVCGPTEENMTSMTYLCVYIKKEKL